MCCCAPAGAADPRAYGGESGVRALGVERVGGERAACGGRMDVVMQALRIRSEEEWALELLREEC